MNIFIIYFLFTPIKIVVLNYEVIQDKTKILDKLLKLIKNYLISFLFGYYGW